MVGYFRNELQNASKFLLLLSACIACLLIAIVVTSLGFIKNVRYDDVLDDEFEAFENQPVKVVHDHDVRDNQPSNKDSPNADNPYLDYVNHLHPEEIDVRALDGDVPQDILDFEAMARPGLGENGTAAVLFDEQNEANISEQMRLYSFNKYVSDKITVRRSLPDIKHQDCHQVKYDDPKDLPKASIVIIFCNEALSVILRTLWSVYDKTPHVMLHEFVLVDDGSTYPEITDLLPKYIRYRMADVPIRLFRLPKQSGLIKAKLVGAEKAAGEIMVFLDSHCEVIDGWLEPLAHYLKYNLKSVAIPIIDIIGDRYLEYSGGPGSVELNIGTFTWSALFMWDKMRPIPEGRKASDPAPTPTMAGGLFAINRKYFWESGSYDGEMKGWGGENLEMSWRIWMCGGSLITFPCSHVGHIFRATNPYPIDVNQMYINSIRAIEVWMDEYKDLFYKSNKGLNMRDAGNLKRRHELRQRLGCKNFTWYLDNVAIHKFVPERHAQAWGDFRNHETGFCFDHLLRDQIQKNISFDLGVYACHGQDSATQDFAYSLEGEIRNEIKCASVRDDGGLKKVAMFKCTGFPNQQWYLGENNTIVHKESGECVTSQRVGSSDLLMKPCDGSDLQRWSIKHHRQ